MNKLRPITILAAGLGGLLWTVKAIVITVNDGPFEPLESVLFVGGLLSLLTAAVLIGLDVTRRFGGIRRVGAAIGVAVAVVAASRAVEVLGMSAVSALASGSNLGLEQEGGILTCGLAWLALAAWSTGGHRSAGGVPAACLALVAVSVLGGAHHAAPAAAQAPHSLSLSGPPTATVGQPSVLQATGTVSDDPSAFLPRYVNVYALPTSVVPTCPATYQNGIQIKDGTIGLGGQTVALAVPVSGSFSIPIAFTSTAAGRFLICGYLHEGVGTDATASHPVDVAAAPPAGDGPASAPPPAARPSSLARPKLTRSGRTLVCGRGRWSGTPERYAYHWTVDGKRKAGAVRRKLRIGRKLRRHRIRCGVTATNAAGSTTALSRARRL